MDVRRSQESLLAIRARIEAMDCYTAQGARDAGLHFADISTEHVKAFRDRILDMFDETVATQQDTGLRDPPDTAYILHEIGRLAKGAALGKAVYGLCPAGCGCIWRDNFDGTMSLGMNQRSCKVCEPKPFADLIPLYAQDEVRK